MESSKSSFLAKLSLIFIKRFRITVLLVILLLGIGGYVYTNLLQREGFPAIKIPYIIVQTPYISGDANKTETEFTSKITEAIRDIEGIETIRSTSTENFSSIVVELPQESKEVEAVKKEIEDQIQKLDNLDSAVEPNIFVPDAGKIDGVNDLSFAIYSEGRDIRELQRIAGDFASELKKNNAIKDATVAEQYSQKFNLATRQNEEVESEFTRVSEKENDELVFHDAIKVYVQKKNDSISSIALSNEVRETVENYRKDNIDNLEDIKFEFIYDQAESLNAQISSLESNAVAAIVTIVIVLFFFINFRSSLILALFIPLTLGALFITFYLTGQTLNTISLFALILVLGLFVDDGTVVVEAIDYYKKKGLKGKDAVIEAVNNIGVADVLGTVTTLLVFVPLIFVSGVLGDFIQVLPITVIAALALSLIIALTVLPLLSMVFIPDAHAPSKNPALRFIEQAGEFVPNTFIAMGVKMGDIVRKYLSNRYTTLAIFIASLVVIVFGTSLAGQLGFSFFAPSKDADEVSVQLTVNDNKDFAVTNEKIKSFEKRLLDTYNDQITEITYEADTASSVSINVNLTPLAEREVTSLEIANEINTYVDEIDGIGLLATSQVAGPPASEYPFAMQVYGESQAELDKATTEITDFMKDLEVSDTVSVKQTVVTGLTQITTKNQKRYVEIKAKFDGEYDSATVIALQEKVEKEFTEEKLKNLGLEKVSLEFDLGQETQNAESFNSVIFATIVAVFVIFGLLVLQFNSFSQPLLILIAIPFSFPGLFAGLLATNNPLSFFVVVGLTGLIGIVVNNTIMLLEYANTQRRAGKSIRDSIADAVTLRFRPILATTMTTVVGLLPLAISEPFWEPLAFTIIFGLLSSVVMVILVFPVYYALFEKLREITSEFFAKRTAPQNG